MLEGERESKGAVSPRTRAALILYEVLNEEGEGGWWREMFYLQRRALNREYAIVYRN